MFINSLIIWLILSILLLVLVSVDELQHAQAEQIENMIASNEIETERGANQIGTLQ